MSDADRLAELESRPIAPVSGSPPTSWTLSDEFKFLFRLIHERDLEIATLRERLEWRPIETAPKDETLFLALTEDGRMMIWRGSLLAHQRENYTPRHLSFPATHWQPLPTTPAPKGEQG